MSVLDNFEQWKSFLADRLHQAQEQGMNQQVISDIAYQIGDYLAKQVDPKTQKSVYLPICGMSQMSKSNMPLQT